MQLPLAVGSNQVELRVTDANGQPLGSYQITIEREDIQPGGRPVPEEGVR